MDGHRHRVVSASFLDDRIAWYENTDGLGTFGPQRIISTSANGARSVFVADLDGDGDVDVLSASAFDDKIAWYENTEGLGTFGPQLLISTEADFASSVFAADLDGDGDDDVLWGAKWNDTIGWEESHLIDPTTCTLDIDGDGDVGVTDLLVLLGAWGTDPGGPPDFNGDLTVDTLDLLELLGQWGPCPENPACGGPAVESCYLIHESPGCDNQACCETVCTSRPICCTAGWDVVCKEMAVSSCGNCGQPSAGVCCEANGSPGCTDLMCCRDVCAIDSFCCNIEWDAMCATEAAGTCASCP